MASRYVPSQAVMYGAATAHSHSAFAEEVSEDDDDEVKGASGAPEVVETAQSTLSLYASGGFDAAQSGTSDSEEEDEDEDEEEEDDDLTDDGQGSDESEEDDGSDESSESSESMDEAVEDSDHALGSTTKEHGGGQGSRRNIAAGYPGQAVEPMKLTPSIASLARAPLEVPASQALPSPHQGHSASRQRTISTSVSSTCAISMTAKAEIDSVTKKMKQIERENASLKKELESKTANTAKLSVWTERHASLARVKLPMSRSKAAGWMDGHVRSVSASKNDETDEANKVYRGLIATHEEPSSQTHSGKVKASQPGATGGEVFFFSDCVVDCGLQLFPGDSVQYMLMSASSNTQQHKPDRRRLPKASKVRLVKIGRSRDDSVYFNWLDEVREFAEKGDTAEFLKRLNASAVWRAIFSTPFQSISWTEKIMATLLELKNACPGHKESYRTLVQSLLRLPFFNPSGGHLMQYLEAASGRFAFDITTVAKFLLELSSADETVIRVALPFLARLTTLSCGPKCPLDACLMQFIRMAAQVGAEDNTELLDWSELPLVPTGEELCSADGSDSKQQDTWTPDNKSAWSVLPIVRRKGPYDSATQYIDTYVRLLREDCFQRLKVGIKDLLANKLDLRDMNVYTNVAFVALEVKQGTSHIENGGQGLSFALHIKPLRPNVNWKASRDLMFGNLLCISTNGTFDRPLWATVASSEHLEKKSIVLVEPCTEIAGSDMAQFINSLQQSSPRSTVMVESPAYYRSYHPILVALQSTNTEEIVFQEEIVKCNCSQQRPPKYLQDPDSTTVDATCLLQKKPGVAARMLFRRISLENLLQHLTDPETDVQMCLDQAQREAMAHVLQNRVSIVQGPPGTGKTYIGVKLIQLLLSSSTLPANAQILVLTYKNHALDEFLLACQSFVDVVRVGGRSEEERLRSCSLGDVMRQDRSLHHSYGLRGSLAASSRELLSAAHSVASANCFTVECFIQFASPEQVMYLLLGVPNTAWPPQLYQCLCSIFPRGHVDEWIKSVPRQLLERVVHYALCCWMPQPSLFAKLQRATERGSVNDHAKQVPAAELLKSQVQDEDLDPLFDEEDVKSRVEERQAAGVSEASGKMAYFSKSNASTWPSLISGIELRAKATASDLARRCIQPWQMSLLERALFIQHLLCERAEVCRLSLLQTLQDYSSNCRQFGELHAVEVTDTLKKKRRLIGMTITGAAIKHQLLTSLKPAIVMVEEAAEVLEPQLLATLGPWVQHLIMIGDHQQLRPPVESYNLVRKHYFDVSMMERLLNNDMPHGLLLTQNRMRPEFSKLLRDIYPDLGDNLAVVSQNMAPKCVAHSMFFWHHLGQETSGRSHTNKQEVEMVTQLALYFVQQGYRPSQVTVLSPYQGQTIVLRRALRERLSTVYKAEDHPDLAVPANGQHRHGRAGKGAHRSDAQQSYQRRETVLVHTIDRYQGDENEIVIVSLVRSNRENKIGFLDVLNRRCVAQSRAKCGLYFVGNANVLCQSKKSAHWATLINAFKEQQLLSSSIPLVCPRHPQKVIHASTAQEIPVNKAGFCNEPCEELLPCGVHFCRTTCQPAHPHKVCRQKVEFTFDACGHSSTKECCQDETRLRCMQTVVFQCQGEGCTASLTRPCWDQGSERKVSSHCDATVTVKLECGHLAQKKCCADKKSVRCLHPCLKILEACGHPCSAQCGVLCTDVPCEICIAIEKKRQELRRKEIDEQIKALELERENALKKAVDGDAEDGDEGRLKEASDDVAKYRREFTLALLKDKLHTSRQPHIVSVSEIENSQLELDYMRRQRQFTGPGVLKKNAVHSLPFDAQTGKLNEFIVQEGFSGEYASFPGNTKLCPFPTAEAIKLTDVSAIKSNFIIWCDVAVGDVHVCKQLPRQLPSKTKCDALYVESDNKWSAHYLLFSHHQIIPRVIVEYRCKPLLSVLGFQLEEQALQCGMLRSQVIESARAAGGDEDKVFSAAEGRFLRNKATRDSNAVVTKVTYYANPVLLEKFVNFKNGLVQMYSGGANKKLRNMVPAFHTTDASNVLSIMQNNFDISKSASATNHAGKFGRGIYFSEFPDYSLHYGGTKKALLMCYVLPGKQYECTKIEPGREKEDGYDSHVYAPDEAGYSKEMCFFNPDQVLPTFHIEFEAKSTPVEHVAPSNKKKQKKKKTQQQAVPGLAAAALAVSSSSSAVAAAPVPAAVPAAVLPSSMATAQQALGKKKKRKKKTQQQAVPGSAAAALAVSTSSSAAAPVHAVPATNSSLATAQGASPAFAALHAQPTAVAASAPDPNHGAHGRGGKRGRGRGRGRGGRGRGRGQW